MVKHSQSDEARRSARIHELICQQMPRETYIRAASAESFRPSDEDREALRAMRQWHVESEKLLDGLGDSLLI